VGEVATRSGVTVSTLHFYAAEGLIHSWRNSGNQRRYAREVLRRIAVIRWAAHGHLAGHRFARPVPPTAQRATPAADDWAKLSADWRADLNDRIDRLRRLRDQLDGCIGCGCLSMGVCPLRTPWTSWPSKGRARDCSIRRNVRMHVKKDQLTRELARPRPGQINDPRQF